MDPIYVANEGKLIAIVAPGVADAVLEAMGSHPRGEQASVIGEVVNQHIPVCWWPAQVSAAHG